MRLKKRKINKQAVALAIAASVAVSAPATANAVTWKAERGTVTVEKTESGVKSSQKNSAGEQQKYVNDDGTDGETSSSDTDIKIVGDGEAKDNGGKDTVESKDTIVEVKGDIKESDNVKITIEGVDNESKSGGAIEVGSGADVDITIKNTDITLVDNEDKTKSNDVSGILVESGEEDNRTNVDITIEGNNTIVSEKDYTKNGNGHAEGLTVGGTSDAAGSSVYSGGTVISSNGATYADVTLSGDDGTLTMNSTSTAIDIKKDSTLEIKNGVSINVGNARTTEDGDNVDKAYSISGRAIMNYGELTIKGNGTEVNIDGARVGISSIGDGENTEDDGNIYAKDKEGKYVTDADDNKIKIKKHNKNNGNVTISDGAKVTIKNADSQGAIYIEQGQADDPEELLIDNATVIVKDNKTAGIVSEGPNVVIKNNSTVTVENASSEGIEANWGADLTIDNSTVNVTNAAGQGGIYMQNSGADNSGELTIKNGSQVTIDAPNTFAGIHAVGNVNATIENKGTETTIKNAGYGVLLQTKVNKADGSLVENQLHVTDLAELTIEKWGSGEGGIVLGYGDEGIKNLLIDKNAEVTIGNGTTNGVYLYGKNKSVVVNDAILNTKKQIVFHDNGTVGDSNKVEIQSKAKVTAPYFVNFMQGGYKFYITGGTLSLTMDAETAKKDWLWGDSDNDGNPDEHVADVLGSDYMTTLYNKQDKNEDGSNNDVAWPTNSDKYGDEKLVNFKLNKTKVKELAESLGTEYSIVGDTLTFTAYGHKEGESADTLYPYEYVVDLSKYDDDEDIDVWVPAVILDYYYPINDVTSEDEKMLDAESLKAKYLTDDEDTLYNNTLSKLKNYTGKNKNVNDVIIRGHSIAFATLKGDYTTNITSEDTDSKHWYYYDKEDGAWKEFTSTTPILVYSRGNALDTAKPIVGLHTHVWDNGDNDEKVDPDCKYEGKLVHYCTDNSHKISYEEILKQTNHKWGTSDEIDTSSPITWKLSDGTEMTVYEYNGKKYYIDEDNHIWIITSEPTTENGGTMEKLCETPDMKGSGVMYGYDEVLREITAGEPSKHYDTASFAKLAPTEPTDPIIPKPDKKPDDNNDNNDKKNTDDSVPVVPAIVPVTPETPAVTPEAPVVTPETPVAEPVAETPAIPAPAETAPAAPATNNLPQTGAALFESIGLAAAGLALSLGSLFGKGKHERK